MKSGRTLTCLLFVLLVSLPPAVAQGQGRGVVIRDATVIDGTGKPPQLHVNIVIEAGRIKEIGPNVKGPDNAQTIEATGKFIIPGLIDARVQIGPTPANRILRGEISIEQRLQSLRALLAAGVTTVRVIQGDWEEQSLYQRWQKEAFIISPRIVTSGPTFTAPGGRPTQDYSIMSLAVRNRETREIANEDEARDRARELAHEGLEIFEVVYEEGSAEDPFPRLDQAAFETVIKEAHGHERKIFCDVGRNEEAATAASSGVDAIEGVWLEALTADSLEQLAKKKISFVPALTEQGDFLNLLDESALKAYLEEPIVQRTLSTILKQSLSSESGFLVGLRKGLNKKPEVRALLEQQQLRAYENVRRAKAQGVLLVLGTGSGSILVFPGAAVHREMQLLVKAGLSPMDALMIATKNTAQMLGKGDELGTLEPGKRADLVILEANPLVDIKNTEKTYQVMQDGRLFTPQDLKLH